MSVFASPFASPFGGSGFFSPPGGSTLGQLDPTPYSVGAGLDQLIDPVSLDYVRTENGEWAETADNRTTMMVMLEMELGASPFDPFDGTRLKALLRSGDPVTPDEIKAETERAGGILVRDGVIADLSVQVRDSSGQTFLDQSGRPAALVRWRDLASGSPIDIIFIPR